MIWEPYTARGPDVPTPIQTTATLSELHQLHVTRVDLEKTLRNPDHSYHIICHML